MRPYICAGDKTSHGGTVLSGSPVITIDGRPQSGVGDKATCPIKGHGGICTIISGDPTYTLNGKAAARHRDKTSCGATLLASQGRVGEEASSSKRIAPLVADEKPTSTSNISPKKNSFLSNNLTDKKVDECLHTVDGAIAVAEFIVKEIKTNSKSSKASRMRSANNKEGESLHYAASLEWAFRVYKDHEWDHKPIIYDNPQLKAVAVHRKLDPLNTVRKKRKGAKEIFFK